MGYVMLLDEEAETWTPENQGFDYYTPVFDTYLVDLREGNILRKENFEPSIPILQTYEMNSNQYVVKGARESQVIFQLSRDGNHQAGFSIPGNVFSMEQIR